MNGAARGKLVWAGLFWLALYVVCVIVALTATPGLPEALGFALPALLAAFVAAWLARAHGRRTQWMIAAAAAAVLMVGAVGGTLGRNQALERQTALETAAASAT